MTKNIKEKPLIKVQTMKQKHFNALHRPTKLQGKDFISIVGATPQQWVVFTNAIGWIYRIPVWEFVDETEGKNTWNNMVKDHNGVDRAFYAWLKEHKVEMILLD